MRDMDIRKALVPALRQIYRGDRNTVVIEELGLCQGAAIVDVAVFNGILHGYEIKSNQDNLERLSAQEEVYNRALDRVTVVASERHIDRLVKMVPSWWGLWRASIHNKMVRITYVRPSRQNPNIDPMGLVQLLWRDEAIEALTSLDMQRGFIKKPRTEIWEKLVNCLSLEDLRRTVKDHIRVRQNWKRVCSQAPNGG